MTVRLIDGLAELAPDYDGFIIDLWGVVHDGATLYPGARQTLAKLAAQGKKTLFLSNAPRRADALIGQMTALGIEPALYKTVMSSGEAVFCEMRDRRDPWFARLGPRCYHLGPARDINLFDGLSLDMTQDVNSADFIVNTGFDGPDDTLERHIPLLERALKRKLPMICANPDMWVIHEGAPYLCAGTLARHYKLAGGDVAYRGKPDPAIYDLCLDCLELQDRRRVLAIGDAFATDVAGARAAGLDSLLIARGIHAAELMPDGHLDASALERAVHANNDMAPKAAMSAFVW